MRVEKKKILAISGSTRKNSSNEAVLKAMKKLYSSVLEIEIYTGIDRLPHFNPDLDNEDPPIAVQQFRNSIKEATGVIICTPEYIFSLPGSLKNAIEWNVSTTLFSNKPVGIIVAAASGEKALESLDLIMTTIESRISKDSKLLIKGIKGKVTEDGEINDPDTLTRIKILVNSLINATDDKNAVPTKYEQKL